LFCVDEESRAAGLEEQLTAPAAGHQGLAVAGHDGYRDQFGDLSGARGLRVQGTDQAAFGAQGEAIGGVLDVAADNDLSGGRLARRADAKT
jgi:hypothetical protein